MPLNLDLYLVTFLNRFVGKSQLVDWAVLFFASYLPWLVVLSVLVWSFCLPVSTKGKWYRFFTIFSAGAVARLGVVEFIRYFYERPRPFVSHPEIHSLIKGMVNTDWSFPSGHASFFFAVATAVFAFDKRFGTLLFFLASLIIIGRVTAGVHYPSDVLAGALVGIISAWIVLLIIRRFSK